MSLSYLEEAYKKSHEVLNCVYCKVIAEDIVHHII